MLRDLPRRWGLRDDDIKVVLESRGTNNRLNAAADLCTLRNTGGFVERWPSLSSEVFNFLASQLRLPIRGRPPVPMRPATMAAWRERAREHLNFRPFEAPDRQALYRQLCAHLESQADSDALPELATNTLMNWRVLRPGPTTLKSLLYEVNALVSKSLCARVIEPLGAAEFALVDGLCAPVSVGQTTSLDQLKRTSNGSNEQAFHMAAELLAELAPLMKIVKDVQIPPAWQRRWCRWVMHHDAWELRRIALTRRRAMTVCFIVYRHREVLDELVELNHVMIQALQTNSKRAARATAREAQSAARDQLQLVADALERLIGADDANVARAELAMTPGFESLASAIEICRGQSKARDTYADALIRRYSVLRRFGRYFVRLPLRAEPGSEALVEGAKLVAHLDDAGRQALPADAPVQFVPRILKRHLYLPDGRLRRSAWEIGLALGLDDALQRGDVFVDGAQEHGSFTEMLFDDSAWAQRREALQEKMGLAQVPALLLARLDQEIEVAAKELGASLVDNAVVRIEGGRVVLGRDRAQSVSRSTRELRRSIQAAIPPVRVEQILIAIDARVGLSGTLASCLTIGTLPRFAWLAALLAAGTNLDVTSFAPSVEGVARTQLERASQNLNAEALAAVNDQVVQVITTQAFDPDDRQRIRTSSDGQRFGVDRRSRLVRYYPRQFGFHQRAMNLYGHHNLGALFAMGVIACNESEALHVVDALLDSPGIGRPDIHHSDTHGATLALFGLCHLLDIELHPWLARPGTRRLYAMASHRGSGAVAELFCGDINRALIAEQWDSMLRTIGSLTERRVQASIALRRMAGSRLGAAFEELGKLVRTRFLLRFFARPAMRRRIRRALNLTESRHKLSRDLCLGNRGRLRGYNLVRRSAALAVLSNCVVAWNTIELNRIFADLEAAGTTVDTQVRAGVSPFKSAHIQLHGTYRFGPVSGGDSSQGNMAHIDGA